LKEELIKWYTNYLSRDFEMMTYGHSGYPVILFSTSHGRFYEHKDFGLIDTVAGMLDEGIIKIYCPDSINQQSLYNKSIRPADRIKTQIAYENMIVNDVMKFAMEQTGFNRVALGGFSFGGYHALNMAFKHPHKTGYLFSMSGAFDIKDFLDGYYDDNCYFNNPPDYMPNLNDESILNAIRQIGIVLGVAEIDGCKDENFRMGNILTSKSIEHWLDFRLGTEHDWPTWRDRFPQYISMISEVKEKAGHHQ
jgi:esterase/lipase superfamily enzyme